MVERSPASEAPSVPEVVDELNLPPTPGAVEPPTTDRASATLAETASDAAARMKRVSRRELEEFLSHAVRLFFQDGVRLRHEGREVPDLDVKITEDMIVVNVRNLANALAWRLAAPADVPPPAPARDQVLDHWRMFLLVEDEPVAAFGRGIPGVQLKTGKASFLLFKDFVKGVLGDRTMEVRAREQERRERVLSEEARYAADRASGP